MHLVRLLSLSGAVLTQQLFINLVPGYSALPPCAQDPVSTLVRGLGGGCNTPYVSYSCICTQSSEHFATQIASSVAQNCPATSQALVTSATDVFASYCFMGHQTGARQGSGTRSARLPIATGLAARSRREAEGAALAVIIAVFLVGFHSL